MLATYRELANFSDAEFTLEFGGRGSNETGVHERSDAAALSGSIRSGMFSSKKSLYLGPVTDGRLDTGLWVHYVAGQATYGYATRGQTWAATGPFSGCKIEAGTIDGRIYMAHISVQSGSTAEDDWDAGLGANATPWLREKIAAASDKFYCASYVFVAWEQGAIGPRGVQISRIDLRTRAMGGTNGQIFRVSRLVG